MSEALCLSKPCPQCKTPKSVEIDRYHLRCSNESCGFSVDFMCPICDKALVDSDFMDESAFKCAGCASEIPLKKVHYLIDNRLIVDKASPCRWCNGPTIHQPDANLGHRCFNFPKCSGQGDLFRQKHEALIFLDFETTGLEAARDHIIEIGALKIDEEGYEHTFSEFIKPPVPIDPRITKITGIDDAMVAGAMDVSEGLKQLLAFIGDGKIVAHNAEFDIPWLLIHSERSSLSMLDNAVLCTLKWARRGDEGRASLGALSKKYKITHNNAHRALADAVATKELYLIFEHMYADVKQEESLTVYRRMADKLLATLA